MKTRLATLISRKAFTASDVIAKDLKGTAVISFLDIIVRMTNGAAMTEASIVKPHDDFKKIEVVNGGDVLCTAHMEEWQSLNAFSMGRMPYQVLTLEDDAVQTEMCRIPFGFYPYDPNYYLRPSDYENLELKVHITMTTAAATAWAAAGHDVTVIAGLMISGYGDYKGFLSTFFHREYTAVDGTEEIVEIPTDYPIKAILIQPYAQTYRPDETVEKVKLTGNDDSHVELDMYMTELEAMNCSRFGPFYQKLSKRLVDDADYAYSDLFLNTYAYAGTGTDLVTNKIVAVDADKITVGSYNQT